MSFLQASYDALVIGGGPAGLAATTSLARACRRVAVFDSHEYRDEGRDQIHNVLIHDGQHPDRFRALGRQEILNSFDSVTFIETNITAATIVPVRDGLHEFELCDLRGIQFRGKKLVLATGSVDILPGIPGFQDLWSDTVYVGSGRSCCFYLGTFCGSANKLIHLYLVFTVSSATDSRREAKRADCSD